MTRMLVALIICSILLVPILLSAANDIQSVTTCPETGVRIFDCAANSVYILARILGYDISYKKCMELVPITEEGNSMLEVKRALESFDFHIEAQEIEINEIMNINVPGIIRTYQPKKGLTAIPQTDGHYIVVLPMDNARIMIMDYPHEPTVLDRDFWCKHLKSIGVQSIQILLSGNQDQEIKGMVVPSLNEIKSSSRTPAIVPQNLNPSISEITLYSRNNIPKSINWDFGTVTEGDHIEHDFRIINDSNRTVHIQTVKKSCGCSKLVTDRNTLMPGQDCNISVFISLAGKLHTQNISATIIFNPTDSIPPLRLAATGFVQPRMNIEPKSIDFGKIRTDSKAIKQWIKISPTEFAGTIEPLRIKCEANYITVTNESDDSKKGEVLSNALVTLDPSRITGKFETKIQVFVGKQEESSISCKVGGEVYSEFIVKPQRLLLVDVANSARNVGSLCVEHEQSKTLDLVEYHVRGCQDDSVNVSQLSPKGGKKLQLTIQVSDPTSAFVRGDLELTLHVGDISNIRSVTVPFVYMRSK